MWSFIKARIRKNVSFFIVAPFLNNFLFVRFFTLPTQEGIVPVQYFCNLFVNKKICKAVACNAVKCHVSIRTVQ
jgi:hypothetical protein